MTTVYVPGEKADIRIMPNEFPRAVPSGHGSGAYVFGTLSDPVVSKVAYYSNSVYGPVAEVAWVEPGDGVWSLAMSNSFTVHFVSDSVVDCEVIEYCNSTIWDAPSGLTSKGCHDFCTTEWMCVTMDRLPAYDGDSVATR